MTKHTFKRIIPIILLASITVWSLAACAQGSFERWRAARDVWSKNEALADKDPHFTIDYGGLTRKYTVHLPPGYNPSTPLPMVIYLHGGGGSISAAYSDKMDQSADKLGFILAVPAGTGVLPNRLLIWNVGRWDHNACCGYAYDHQVDDVGFVSAMIDDVKTNFSVDGSRVYATGISNGGLFAYLLGCALPGKIAAVAPVAPPAVPDGCATSRPVSIMHGRPVREIQWRYGRNAGSRQQWRVYRGSARRHDGPQSLLGTAGGAAGRILA